MGMYMYYIHVQTAFIKINFNLFIAFITDTEPTYTMSELMNIIAININKKWKDVSEVCRILTKNQYHTLLMQFGLQLGLTKPVISWIEEVSRNVSGTENTCASPAYSYKWSTIDKALRNPTIDNKDLANKLDQEISWLKNYCGKYDEVYK